VLRQRGAHGGEEQVQEQLQLSGGRHLPPHLLQRGLRLAGGLHAQPGVPLDHPSDRRRQLREDLLQLGRLGVGVSVQRLADHGRDALAAHQPPADRHLPQHRAEREQVDARLELAGALPDLRRHVAGGALEHAGGGLGDRGRGLGDAEVGDLGAPAAGQEHVGGLQVPVHQVQRLAGVVGGPVSVVQGLGDLDADVEDDRRRQRQPRLLAGGQQPVHRHAIDELHGDVPEPVGLGHAVDIDDVGVVEVAADAGLVHQRLEVLVGGSLLLEDLQGHLLAEAEGALLGGQPDLGERALAQPSLQTVRRELVAGLQLREQLASGRADRRSVGGRIAVPV